MRHDDDDDYLDDDDEPETPKRWGKAPPPPPPPALAKAPATPLKLVHVPEKSGDRLDRDEVTAAYLGLRSSELQSRTSAEKLYRQHPHLSDQAPTSKLVTAIMVMLILNFGAVIWLGAAIIHRDTEAVSQPEMARSASFQAATPPRPAGAPSPTPLLERRFRAQKRYPVLELPPPEPRSYDF